jgi:hypothetical protein
MVWMIAKPFIALCIPLLVSVSLMFSMSGKSFGELFSHFSLPSFDSLKDQGGISILPDSSQQQVYKWKDKEGVWHFSEHAPAEVQTKQFESFTVSSQITTIQMPKPEVPKGELASKRSGSQGFIIKDPDNESDEKMGELASDPIELINQAKAIAEKMNQRNQSLEGM